MTSHILVTGASGQLGQEIQLLSLQYPQYHFIFTDTETLDISSEAHINEFFEELKPKYCINCAAYTQVDLAESEVEKAYVVNETGVLNLVNACKKYQSCFLHISTDFVFNGSSCRPIDENSDTDPINIYGKSKLAGERAIQDVYDRYIIIRTSWLYSSFGNNFVKTMYKLGKEKPALRIVKDQVGSPTYAKDLAQVLLQIIEKLEGGNNSKEQKKELYGLYHYSNEGVSSWYDFAQAVMDIALLPTIIEPIPSIDYPTPAQRPHYSVMDKSKIKNTFQLNIPYWRHSLNECLSKIQKGVKPINK